MTCREAYGGQSAALPTAESRQHANLNGDRHCSELPASPRRSNTMVDANAPMPADHKKVDRCLSVLAWVSIASFVLLLLILLYGSYTVYRVAHVHVPNAYAMERTGGLIVEHLRANDNAWPKGWEDLRDDFGAANAASRTSFTFEELQQRIEIDWDADPVALAKVKPSSDKPPFRVVGIRDGKDVAWGATEPNRMIHEYLREQFP